MQKTKTLITENGSDFIFKYGNYLNTYIIVTVEGTPNNVTLSLVDENLNQLYSPYDVNGGEITSICTADVNSTNVIQLPANFNNDLSSWTDFEPDIYNWNLYWAGNDIYESITLPLTIEIRDFETWSPINTEIYSYEDIDVKIRTYVDTIPDTTPLLTTNATYDNTTGIITYPSQDLNTTPGEHTQLINGLYQQELNYIIKNPITFSKTPLGTMLYEEVIPIGVKIKDDCELEFTSTLSLINIDGIPQTVSNTTTQYQCINAQYYTPGIHHCTIESTLNDTNTYTITDTFEILTTGCSLTLEELNNTLVSTYIYEGNLETIPIANAQLGLINSTTGVLVETQTTDAQGQVTWQTSTSNNDYYVVAIDIDGNYVTESTNTFNSLQWVDGNHILDAYNNDTLTLTCQLKNDNNDIQIPGINVDIYKDDTYIETQTTDNNGTISFTYTAIGAGDFNISAKIENLTSNLYKIRDFKQIYYQNDGTRNDISIGSGGIVTVENGALKITTTTSGEKKFIFPTNKSFYTYDNVVLELESARGDETGNIMGLSIHYSVNAYSDGYAGYWVDHWESKLADTTVNVPHSLNNGDIIRFVREDGYTKLYHNDDLIASDRRYINGDKFGGYTNQNRIQRIKNIIIYKL